MSAESEAAFLKFACAQAKAAGHIFPEMAACEAALESRWGNSQLYQRGMNAFGQKQSHPPLGETLDFPTKEYVHGDWITVLAHWVVFPSLLSCFADRMATLQRLRGVYPHYDAALRAKSPEAYIAAVSQTWSTDPHRAEKVLAIYQAHRDVFA